MSYYAVQTELSFDLPASTLTRAQGGFAESDQADVIGRWVQRDVGNTVKLLLNDARPLGVITRITGTKVAVAVGPIVRGKRGPNAVLGVGVPVTGATRQESASGSAEPGFVKPMNTSSTTVDQSVAARGYALGGGTATTANTEGGLEDVLMYS